MLASALDTLVTFNPWTLTAHTSLAEAARLLDETGIFAWPAVDDSGALVGVLTSEALAQAVVSYASPHASIAAFISPDITPLALCSCPLNALERMLANGQRMTPVEDAGRIVGTLSTCDFLRELSYGTSRAARELVVDHLERNTEPVDSDATLAHVAELVSSTTRPVVVVQGDFPLGSLTPAAIAFARVQQFARQQRGAASADRTVGQILCSAPTIAPGRSLGEAASLMIEHQLDALAVASQSAQLQGVITESHILQALLEYER